MDQPQQDFWDFFETRCEFIVQDVVNAILDSPKFWSGVRGLVLRTVFEQDRIREFGLVRSFLNAAEGMGVRFWINEKNALCANKWKELGPDLQKTLRDNKPAIRDFLTHYRDLERFSRSRESSELPKASTNGKVGP